jgi:murein DD-endopeptidase MepM/ murein hydrolase activator NlpD
MKKVSLILTFLFFLILTGEVIYAQSAQSFTSNKVITQVGEPTDPKPDGGEGNVNTGGHGLLGFSVSCPLDKENKDFTVTCGTKEDPNPGVCGHAGISYPQPCSTAAGYSCPGGQYSPELTKSLDVTLSTGGGNTVNKPVYLPSISGESVNWNISQAPFKINNSFGWKVYYKTTYQGKAIEINFTHINQNINQGSNLASGTPVATIYPVDGASAGHLHTALAVDGRWIEPRIDAGMCSHRAITATTTNTTTTTPPPPIDSTGNKVVKGDSGGDEDWYDIVSDATGLTGQLKWLSGSTGMDIFVARGTVVKAPFAGTITGGVGSSVVLTADNGFTARFLHVAPLVRTNTKVQLGQPLATVNDSSLDILRWPGGQYGTPPDGYQHLDLSLATNPSGLNWQGGAGGNLNSYQYVTTHGGIANMQVISKTPGPLEGSR